MSEPFKLFRLQQIDSQLDQHHTRLREIEITLADLTAILSAQAKKNETNNAFLNAKKTLHRAEELVEAQRIKIEQVEASLYGGKIRNPKELQDLQNEAAALKRYRTVLEDKQLDAMMTCEEAETLDSQAADILAIIQRETDGQGQILTREKNILLLEVERLESERSAARSAIPEGDEKLYEQLRVQRKGIAVSKVKDKNCTACGSTLSAALLHEVRSTSQIARCERCGRILYSG